MCMPRQTVPPLLSHAAFLPDIVCHSFGSRLLACSAQSDGEQYRRTGVQLQGVLDSLYSYEGPLGARQSPEGAWSISLWAPTAQRVSLELFEGPRGGSAQQIEMQRGEKGQWTAEVSPAGLRIFSCMIWLLALVAR